MKKKVIIGAVLLAIIGVVWGLVMMPHGLIWGAADDENEELEVETESANDEDSMTDEEELQNEANDDPAVDEEEVNNEEEEAEEDNRDEEEKAVDDFDELTDRWMEASEKGVTLADIDNFSRHFRRVPEERRDECIHRALNLIPDENVMLLAGVLMDKSIDKDIIETVFNDVLNRDEKVKLPILQQIFKDKTHPCWADTAWILEATGDLPKGKK